MKSQKVSSLNTVPEWHSKWKLLLKEVQFNIFFFILYFMNVNITWLLEIILYCTAFMKWKQGSYKMKIMYSSWLNVLEKIIVIFQNLFTTLKKSTPRFTKHFQKESFQTENWKIWFVPTTHSPLNWTSRFTMKHCSWSLLRTISKNGNLNWKLTINIFHIYVSSNEHFCFDAWHSHICKLNYDKDV